MKKITLLLMLTAFVFSCNNSEEKKDVDQTATTKIDSTSINTFRDPDRMYRGEFIYTKDAAVLKGKDFIYGVTLNEKAEDLAKQVDSIKKEPYDMVPVIVEGDLKDKAEGDEGWDQILTITRILNVSHITVKPDIKLKETPKKNQ
jgi:hypothetical protein